MQCRHKSTRCPDRLTVKIGAAGYWRILGQQLCWPRSIVSKIPNIGFLLFGKRSRVGCHEFIGSHHANPFITKLDCVDCFISDQRARCIDRHNRGHICNAIRQPLCSCFRTKKRTAPCDIQAKFIVAALAKLLVQPLESTGARTPVWAKLAKSQLTCCRLSVADAD